MAVLGIQNLLDFLEVLGTAHERMCNEVNIGLDCPMNEFLVLFRNGRQIYMDIRDIDTLVSFDYTLVHHFAYKLALFFADNRQIHGAVVNQNVGTYRNIFGHVRICSVESPLSACFRRIVNDFYDFIRMCYEPHGICHLGKSDLRSFRVNEYGDTV